MFQLTSDEWETWKDKFHQQMKVIL
jgi:hypothetical protein